MKLSRDPLRLILGGILVIFGILALLSISIPIPGSGLIFTVAGVIAGFLLLFKTRYL
jgi:hypothetical protein